MPFRLASQSRLGFDAQQLRDAGIVDVFATPFDANCESLLSVEEFRRNVEELRRKRDKILPSWPGATVSLIMFTIAHPEGNFKVPSRYRLQRDIDGALRPGFVCFRDEKRQEDLLQMYKIAAETGIDRIMIDDDFRDAFCFCDEHLRAYEPFARMSRDQIKKLLNDPAPSDEVVEIRRGWLDFKRASLEEFARKIERTIHSANPCARIGICVSAKRCNDLSGRFISDWVSIFNTPQAPVFLRLPGEHYGPDITKLAQSLGWHQYYRELVPEDIEQMAEVTYVYFIAFKSAGHIATEVKAHLASGLDRVLLAWTSDYDHNLGWPMLKDSAEVFKAVAAAGSQTAHARGVAIYCPEDVAEYVPYDEAAETEPIKAYQALAWMGIPVRMVASFDAWDEFAVVSGHFPAKKKDEITGALESGSTIVLDSVAAAGFARAMDPSLVKYRLDGVVAGVAKERFDKNGPMTNQVALFPCDSIHRLAPHPSAGENVEVTSELFDTSGERVGAGSLVYPALNGTVVVLAYDISKVCHRLTGKVYSDSFSRLFARVGYDPGALLRGDLYVQLLLFSRPSGRAVLVNYNSYPAMVELAATSAAGLRDVVAGKTLSSNTLQLAPLDVRIVDILTDSRSDKPGKSR